MILSKTDWIKVLKGAGIAFVGAGLTALSQWASGQDFGIFTPAVVAILSVAVNALRKWVMPTSEVEGVVKEVINGTLTPNEARVKLGLEPISEANDVV